MWVLTYYYSLILSCYDFLTIALLLSFSGSMGESFCLSAFSKLRKEFFLWHVAYFYRFCLKYM